MKTETIETKKSAWIAAHDELGKSADLMLSMTDFCDRGRHFSQEDRDRFYHAHTLFEIEQRKMYVLANTLPGAPENAANDDVPSWLPDYKAAQRWLLRNIIDHDNTREIQRAESGYPD